MAQNKWTQPGKPTNLERNSKDKYGIANDSLMFAKISDDTCNVLNTQHIVLNSKRFDYSDIHGGGS